jgi:hypothetical protein
MIDSNSTRSDASLPPTASSGESGNLPTPSSRRLRAPLMVKPSWYSSSLMRLIEEHFMVLVVATVAATLDRPQLGEFLLPVAQHMRLDPTQFADFTDREVALGRYLREFGLRLLLAAAMIGLFHHAAFSFWLAWKVTTRRAVIGISSPVLGLRPGRCGFSRNWKLPKPESLTLSPFSRASAHLVEEGLDHVLGLTLVEADFFEQQIGEFGLGQCHMSSDCF